MKIVGFVLVALGLAGTASAQVASATNQLVWDEVAPDLATVQSYTYKSYADGSGTGTALSGVSCAGTASPFTCQVAFPAFTPGSHTIALSASSTVEGPKSPVLSFSFVVVPNAPQNLRIRDDDDDWVPYVPPGH